MKVLALNFDEERDEQNCPDLSIMALLNLPSSRSRHLLWLWVQDAQLHFVTRLWIMSQCQSGEKSSPNTSFGHLFELRDLGPKHMVSSPAVVQP